MINFKTNYCGFIIWIEIFIKTVKYIQEYVVKLWITDSASVRKIVH